MTDTNATKYALAFPLAKKNAYYANETIDFIVSLENKKLVPGSVVISGDCFLAVDASGAAPGTTDDIEIDPDAGYHSLFRDVETVFRQVGVTETFPYYPRFVKMKTQATMLRDSLGTETYNCIEGKCPTGVVRRGYNYGETDKSLTDNGVTYAAGQSFAFKPDIAVNKSNEPIPGNQVGTIRIRIRLAPNEEVIFGESATSACRYVLSNLKLHYEAIADDGSRPPLQMEVYSVNRQVLETNNANLSTFVPIPCDAVHMSFNSVADEQDVTKNYLRCLPLPGNPQLAAGGNMNSAYGADRLYYAVNDTDTALVGFTMEFREEMLWNYLRSFKNEPTNWNVTLERYNGAQADSYGLGINFGGLIDFSQQKFAVEIDSNTSTPHSAYLFFRGLVQL